MEKVESFTCICQPYTGFDKQDKESISISASEETLTESLKTVDCNSPENKKYEGTRNMGGTLELFEPLIKYGRFSMVLSYGIFATKGSEGIRYCTRKPRIWGIISFLIYIVLCISQTMVVAKFNFNISYSKLVNMIKRVTYAVFIFKLIVVYFCLHYHGRTRGYWVKILKQADLVQTESAKLGINLFRNKRKLRLITTGICIMAVVLCVVHIIVFTLPSNECRGHSGNNTDARNYNGWYRFKARKVLDTLTLGFFSEDVLNSVPELIVLVLGLVGLLVNVLVWNMWYFVDAFRLITALLVWVFYKELNQALRRKQLGVDELTEVLDLHFQGTKLLNLMNVFMGPVTLFATAFNILYVCFWTNYLLINVTFRTSYVVSMITFTRMVVVFYFVSDVNTQAYQITTWLENNFSLINQQPQKVDKAKLSLFTALIYNRDAIGFKGMHFFTCTPALNIAIGGLVLTYTLVVNQVVTQ